MEPHTRGVALLQTPLNAGIGWIIVVLMSLVLLEGLVGGDIAQVVLTAGVIAVVIAAPVTARNPRLMVPWELVLLAALPIVALILPLPAGTTTFVQYVAVAAFALIVVVSLHAFTELSVTHGFAVLLVTLTTLASAGFWAVLRYQFDQRLGTSFLTTNDVLMQEFAVAIASGVVAGVVFAVYFRRQVYAVRRRFRGVVRP